MSTFNCTIFTAFQMAESGFKYSGWDVNGAADEWDAILPGDIDNLVDFGECEFGVEENKTPSFPVEFSCDVFSLATMDWFGFVHIFPRSIELGNILSEQQVTIEIFNADRDSSHELQSWTNDAGTGITIPDLPVLPFTINPIEGLSFTLTIATTGPPNIDGTQDFAFDVYTAQIPITGSRIVAFPFRPEIPLRERLLFNTDIIEKVDGSEQRIGLRKNPRVEFEMTVRVADGAERQRMDNILLDWQSRVFGVPMWHEPTLLTSNVSVGDTVLNVRSTAHADYRVGGLIIILQDEKNFDVLEIQSFTANTITIESPATKVFSSGTDVMPMRSAYARRRLQGQRFLRGFEDMSLNFRVIDNDSNLADTSAFSTYDSKVLLDDFNWVETTMDEGFTRNLLIIDNETGQFSQQSPWDISLRNSVKGFATTTPQELWNVRRLLYALDGRRISFWLPTFAEELTLSSDIVSGENTIQVVNVGYTQFVKNRDQRNVIQLTLSDNTKIIRTVTTSSVVDADNEQLTLDTSFASNIAASNVTRIEYFEKVRMTSDNITINHQSANGDAKISLPVRTIIE